MKKLLNYKRINNVYINGNLLCTENRVFESQNPGSGRIVNLCCPKWEMKKTN